MSCVSAKVHDSNSDGLQDILFGRTYRGLQILINAGDRAFNDETRRRPGIGAWCVDEAFHVRHRLFDFNRDCTLDIVPELYDIPNILAWLNDGTGHLLPAGFGNQHGRSERSCQAMVIVRQANKTPDTVIPSRRRSG